MEQLSLITHVRKVAPTEPLLTMPDTPLTGKSTINEALIKYQNHLIAGRYKTSTADAYAKSIRNFSRGKGDLPVGKPTNEMKLAIESFIAHQKRVGMDEKTVACRINALRNFFGWLTDERIIPYNPMVKIFPPHVKQGEPIVLSKSQYDEYMKAAENDVRDLVFAIIALEAGPKRSELVLIDETDVNVESRYRPTVWIARHDRLHRRELELPTFFVDAFKEYVTKPRNSSNLFGLAPRGCNYVSQEIAERAGLDMKVPVSVLRDTYAIRRISAGVDVVKVLKSLGLQDRSIDADVIDRYKMAAVTHR
jgi:integrase/recombinase XerD